MLRFPVDVVSLRRLSKCIPDETNSLSMCDRINKLEQRIQITEEALPENVSKPIQIEGKVNKFGSYSAIAKSNLGSGKQTQSSIQNETIASQYIPPELFTPIRASKPQQHRARLPPSLPKICFVYFVFVMFFSNALFQITQTLFHNLTITQIY